MLCICLEGSPTEISIFIFFGVVLRGFLIDTSSVPSSPLNGSAIPCFHANDKKENEQIDKQ